MHSDLIGKIEKARRYAEEPERISVAGLKATFRGGSSDHEITLTDDRWECNCSFFKNWNTCAHVMAVQKVLTPMLSEKAQEIGSPDGSSLAEVVA
jgi:hypothetical protein